MNKMKKTLSLFWDFFRIGLFTFGGGYAMIALIEKEIVERKKLIDKDEFLDVVAISESTPGPIAINSATYIGYKICGFFGAFFATFGVVLPSFIIILLLSIFIEKFNLLEIEYISYAFKGINACVAFLILSAGIKMFKKQKKSILNLILCVLTFLCFVALSIFDIKISSIYFIIFGAFIGFIQYLISIIKIKRGDK